MILLYVLLRSALADYSRALRIGNCLHPIRLASPPLLANYDKRCSEVRSYLVYAVSYVGLDLRETLERNDKCYLDRRLKPLLDFIIAIDVCSNHFVCVLRIGYQISPSYGRARKETNFLVLFAKHSGGVLVACALHGDGGCDAMRWVSR